MAQQIINTGTAPNDRTGNTLRDSFIKTNDNFTELYNNLGGYLFQVGGPSSGHIHYALLTMLQAEALIQGTDSLIPVADPLQPSVVITSATNGPSPHTHDLTVYFDYVNHTFTVTNITNNALDNHVASLIGTSSTSISLPSTEIAIGSGTGVTSSPTFTFDPATGGFKLNFDSSFTTPTLLSPAAVFINGANSINGDGANLNISSGAGAPYVELGPAAKAGDITLYIPPGSSHAGDISLQAGSVSGISSNPGGAVRISAGLPGESIGEFGYGGGNVWISSGTPFIGSGVFITGGDGGEGGFSGLVVNGRGSLGFGTYYGDPTNQSLINYGALYRVPQSMGVTSPPTWIDPVFKPAPMVVFNDVRTAADIGCARDHNMHYRMQSATVVTLIVQPDSFWPDTSPYYDPSFDTTSPMPVGGTMVIGKHGIGNVIFQAGPGVTIHTPETLILSKLNGKITLTKVAPDEWDIEGNLQPV